MRRLKLNLIVLLVVVGYAANALAAPAITASSVRISGKTAESTTIKSLPANGVILSKINTTTLSSHTWYDSQTLFTGSDDCCGFAVSGTNVLHLAYYDAAAGGLIYSTNESGSWVSTVIDSNTTYSDVHDVTLTYDDGKLHVAYVIQSEPDDERTYTSLMYATNKTGEWETDNVESGDFLSGFDFKDVSIAVDKRNYVYIVYEDYYKGSGGSRYLLKYSKGQLDSAWTDTTIENDTAQYYRPSFFVDDSYDIHLAYYTDYTDKEGEEMSRVFYANNSSGSFKKEVVSTAVWDSESYTAIDLDQAGKIHVVFEDNGKLIHARKTSDWNLKTIDEQGGSHPDMLAKSSTEVYVSYYQSSQLKLASTRTLGSWQASSIVSGASGKSVLEQDENEFLYILYPYGSKVMLVSTYSDTDGDGTENTDDTDDDNDGVLDGADAFPNDATESLDTDGDGVGDNVDTDDNGDGFADDDTDGDGVENGSDAFPSDASESVDTDSDGVGDNADDDDDGDGALDTWEAAAAADSGYCNFTVSSVTSAPSGEYYQISASYSASPEANYEVSGTPSYEVTACLKSSTVACESWVVPAGDGEFILMPEGGSGTYAIQVGLSGTCEKTGGWGSGATYNESASGFVTITAH